MSPPARAIRTRNGTYVFVSALLVAFLASRAGSGDDPDPCPRPAASVLRAADRDCPCSSAERGRRRCTWKLFNEARHRGRLDDSCARMLFLERVRFSCGAAGAPTREPSTLFVDPAGRAAWTEQTGSDWSLPRHFRRKRAEQGEKKSPPLPRSTASPARPATPVVDLPGSSVVPRSPGNGRPREFGHLALPPRGLSCSGRRQHGDPARHDGSGGPRPTS
ncbi:MAG: hypothetical protein KatS3mg076_3185 [Candidatus Binatia bacterium]|nr:MAG: hypothetical protein KatS3mg076_3185 [Candidatus Binatia bacterium]